MAGTVFIFRADDGRTREERLKEAALRTGYRKGWNGESVSEASISDGAAFEKSPVPGRELWRIARTERGKPYFPNLPELHFSISHSGAYWVCAFSAYPIGVDIQKHVKKKGESQAEAADRFGKMAKRFFHPREARWVNEDPGKRFFQIWAAKESYVKYAGTGIGADF